MPLSAITARSVSDQIFEQLLAGIIGGQFAAGEHLPSERELVTTFRVNRHGVREALKRLQQVGLIRIAQGGGTTVLDFKRHAGLDLLGLLSNYTQTGEVSMGTWLAVHEMRTVIAADAARLCALRGSAELKASILTMAGEMKGVGSGPRLFELELRFWDLVLEGAGNIAYRLAFNTLVRGISTPQTRELASQASQREVQHAEFRVPLAKLIADGDADAASRATTESMRGITELLAPFLPPTASPPPSPAKPRAPRPAKKAAKRRAR